MKKILISLSLAFIVACSSQDKDAVSTNNIESTSNDSGNAVLFQTATDSKDSSSQLLSFIEVSECIEGSFLMLNMDFDFDTITVQKYNDEAIIKFPSNYFCSPVERPNEIKYQYQSKDTLQIWVDNDNRKLDGCACVLWATAKVNGPLNATYLNLGGVVFYLKEEL